MVTLYGASDLEKCFNSRDGKSKPGYYGAIPVPITSKYRLKKLTLTVLKGLARDHGLSVGGKKAELISRLLDNNAPPIILYKCPKCKFQHFDEEKVRRHASKRDEGGKTHMKI